MTGPKMCSKLWTIDILTLMHVLTLLFAGLCQGRVTISPSPVISPTLKSSTNQVSRLPSMPSQVSINPIFTTLERSPVRPTPSTALTSAKNVSVNSIVSAIRRAQESSTVTPKYSNTSVTTISGPTAATNSASTSTTNFVSIATTNAASTATTTSASAVTSMSASTLAAKSSTPLPPHPMLEERVTALDCDLPLLPNESRLWRGNETHELNLPITMPEDCPGGTSTAAGALEDDCPPVILSWEGAADIQSGDMLIVRIDDTELLERAKLAGETSSTKGADVEIVNNFSRKEERRHRSPPQPAVYQVTRQGHEHCDVTEGVLLDITPLAEHGGSLVALYDKDLTEGVNLLIVVSEGWGSQCVRLKVTVKSDNCGGGQNCSGKGVCYSDVSMEGYECQCCPGYMGPHCEEQDACNPSPCLNQGICVDITQGHDGALFQCLCPYGFTGKTCAERADPCSTAPCQNGGRCRGAESSSGNESSWRCACPSGWAGERCERRAGDASACGAQPCVHGICVEQDDAGEKGYRCFCQPGFAGVRCEYEYNECESSPCANGGTCTDHVGGFSCTCGRGYTGPTCQLKVDLCSPNPCTSRRYCIDRGNSYACECPRGFTGIDCLLPAKDACDNNPCAHGGTCWSGVDSFYCACRPGYTGKLCEDDFILESVLVGDSSGEEEAGYSDASGSVREVRLPLALYRDRLHNMYIAAGTLGTAIVIVGVVVTACHCRLNKTYERFLSRVYNMTDPGPPHHWLEDKPPQHSRQPIQPSHPTPLHAPLDTADMYYTLDFSDNQRSPLIQ